MGKLFIKLWALIILTSLTSYFIQRQIFNWTIEEANAAYTLERQKRTFIFIEETLRPYPKAEWPSRLEVVAARLGSPARLTTVDALANSGELNAGETEKIRSNAIHIQQLAEDVGVVMYRTIHDSEYVAALEIPAPPQPRILGILKPVVFTWIVECTLYALAILLWLRLFWRDLMRLSTAAEKIGANNNNDLNVTLRRGSALQPLGDSFNRMSNRIKALMNSHQELTSAVSHELKTPLSRLRFAITLLPDAATPAEQAQLIKKMQRDVDDLDALVQEMLVYAKLERDTPMIEMASTTIQSWLPNAIDDEVEAATIEDNNIPVMIHSHIDKLACEPKFMARAVRNLVRNALRFATTSVDVTIQQDSEKFSIHVDDDGPGIPLNQRAQLFVPFARLDTIKSREPHSSSNSSGNGLGLAIVKRIAEWHGGDATISESASGGARISICWPISRHAVTL
jgi:two-component system, OmpR family, sensor kinase ParS